MVGSKSESAHRARQCRQAEQAVQAALAARKEQAGKLASSRLTGGALRLPHVASKLSQLELSRVERRDILPDTSGNVRERVSECVPHVSVPLCVCATCECVWKYVVCVSVCVCAGIPQGCCLRHDFNFILACQPSESATATASVCTYVCVCQSVSLSLALFLPPSLCLSLPSGSC